MTPRNPLDGKCIVDRESLAAIITIVTSCNADYAALGNMRGMTYTMDAIQLMEEALAQDLTGWAAVPIYLTNEMFVKLDGGGGERWREALNASPPLPRGGE
jgi:hypothetical protein